MEQKYFPRGGAKDTPVIQYKKFVFEKKKPTKINKHRRKEKQKFKSVVSSDLHGILKFKSDSSHFHLTQENLKPGLVCICAVQGFTAEGLIVNLPYGKSATVLNHSISASYSDQNDGVVNNIKQLSNMFFVGQLLSCKIIKCESVKNGSSKIFATLNPSDVNRNINAGMVSNQTLIQMAVSSVEDHGYFMDCGVAGVMAFLPFNQAAKFGKKVLSYNQPLILGAVLWCYITKSSLNGSGANVVEVSVDPHLTSVDNCVHPMRTLWPGARVKTNITKVFKDGCCQVLVDGTDIRGSVSPLLDYKKDITTDYTVGTCSEATVMLYNPVTNEYNFSFSHHVGKTLLPYSNSKIIKRSQQHKATILKVDDIFMHLTIPNMQFKGVISMSYLAKRKSMNPDDDVYKEHTEMNDDEPSFANYQSGEKIAVQINQTDFLSNKYVCSILSKNNSVKKDKNKTNNAMKRGRIQNDKLLGIDEIKKESESDSDSDRNLEEKKKKKKRQKLKGENPETAKIKFDSEEIKDEVMSDTECKEEIISDIECKEEIDSDIEFKSEAESQEEDFNEELDRDLEVRKSLLENKNAKKRKLSRSELNLETSSKKIKSSNSKVTEKQTSKSKKNKVDAASQFSIAEADSNFMWDATPEDLARVTSKDVEELNEESDEETVHKKPLSKKHKKINELEKERKIREKEEELMKALEEPKSADHYERLILSRPDDSRIWIKYMAFHLEATEIEKARVVGKRALQLINHRNEQDKLNIWLALLNLEYLYGSKDLFKETWSESLKYNDDYKVNCKVLDMYANGCNMVEVASLVQRMTKQYKENCECWHVCLSALMSAKMQEKARDLLQRALKSLPAKSHVTLISRFALLENSHGFSEESQSLFDNLLTSYPARVDIWFVYLDMLIKSNFNDLARQVFERATSQKLPAKKMKSIYKKWLEFEEKHGSVDSVEMVRKSAMQYVEEATKDVGR